jgi:hypothetical protein
MPTEIAEAAATWSAPCAEAVPKYPMRRLLDRVRADAVALNSFTCGVG